MLRLRNTIDLVLIVLSVSLYWDFNGRNVPDVPKLLLYCFTGVLSQNIIGEQTGKVVIDEYMWRRGYSHLDRGGSDRNVSGQDSGLQAYVKPPSVEVSSSSGSKRPSRVPRGDIVSSDQENQGFPRKVEPMHPKPEQYQEKEIWQGPIACRGHKGSIVFLQIVSARRHRLVSNCLSGGEIVCKQEGEGPCSFCGALVL